jgi:TetR/AcrR family transcriptional repressor of bet genes
VGRAFGGELEKERRQLILDAAAACVTEDGIEGATMKKVASRAGVSTGMIADYFKDKNQLMIETLSAAAADFRARLTEEAGAEPGLKRLQKIFDLSFPGTPDSSRNPWPFWLEFASEARRNDDLRGQLLKRISTIRGDLERCSAAAVEAGEIKPDIDARLAADLLLAVYHGLGTLMTVHDEAMSPERAHQVEEMALALLASTLKD